MENAGAQLLGEIWEQGQPVNDNFEIDADEDDDRDADGAMDGGVAFNPEEACERAKRRSRECDLILYFYCEEEIDAAQGHPVARPGVVVSIGLDKNTKMAAVFNRYVDFCNETEESELSVKDLEFVHCQLLSGSETAEANALMKNDRILVRKIRTKEREADEARKRLQRDADRNFFLQLRKMLPDLEGSKTSDVVLDCRGKVIDESGMNQQVLRTTVRAHYVIVKKRCPWLGEIIDQARREAKQHRTENENMTPDEDLEKNDENQELRRVESDGKSSGDLEEDDGIVLSFQPKEKREDTSAAAEIENDDDEEEELPFDEPRRIEDQPRPHSPVMSSFQQTSAGRELLVVQIPDHSPEAVKLLLEYCYSNRVYALGHEAFVQACKSRPHKHQGPVPPYHGTSSGSKRWPNCGLPTVSLSVALAGVSLAEEARMPRLSLMCEVAASQLLCTTNVVEALSMCTHQKNLSGNDLPRLRKAAMDIVLGCGSRGVTELGRTPAFRKALEERRAVIVPTLLHGTMEAVTSHDKSRGMKRDRTEITYPPFDSVDREDKNKRERERRKWRQERWERNPDSRPEPAFEDELDSYYEPAIPEWATEPSELSKRALKRMAHHVDTMTARAASAVNRLQPVRRTSNRRRSIQK